MTPAEPRTAVGRLSATLALRPDAKRVRLRLGTAFIEHRLPHRLHWLLWLLADLSQPAVPLDG